MRIFVLLKRETDFGFHDAPPVWENAGYTTKADVIAAWVKGAHQGEKRRYEELEEITL